MTLSSTPQAEEAQPIDNPSASEPYADYDFNMLSQRFAMRFYQHDWEWCLPYCDRDVEYLGSIVNGTAKGIDELESVMTKVLSRFNPSLPIITRTDVQMLSDNLIVLVSMHYILIAESLERGLHCRRKRGTMIWRLYDSGPRLCHLHFSSPSVAKPDRNPEPNTLHDSFLSVRALIEQLPNMPGITLHDSLGNVHRISPPMVRYVEADRQKTIVHCLDDDIIVNEGFTNTLEKLGKHIVRVHRSFAVNPTLVRVVRSSSVVLDDGTAVPLPQRRAREVRLMLEETMRSMNPPFVSLADHIQT